MFVSDREDGRFIRTDEFLYESWKRLRPKLAYEGGKGKEAFALWQRQVAEKLEQLMKFPEFAEEQPAPRMLWEEARDGYALQKWEAFPEPYSVVPFLLLVPDGADERAPAPAVLCFTGSNHTKEMLAGEPDLYSPQFVNRFPEHNQMAQHYAKAGMVAVAVENPGIGELHRYGEDENRGWFSREMLMLGRNYMGLSVFQKLNILQWLKRQPFVDAARIAVSGHSLGSGPAMMLAALDRQIQAVVFNDFLCDNRVRRVVSRASVSQPSWHIVPDMLEWFAFPDILASLAPMPLLITEGGVTADLRKVKLAYAELEAEGRMEFHYYPKYASAERRQWDMREFPQGLDQEQFFECANVDAPNHYFKEHLAVPWLKRVLKV